MRKLEIETYFSVDVAKVHEVIKVNKHLKELRLTIPDAKDHRQIFERFKALFANHTVMMTLVIHQARTQQAH